MIHQELRDPEHSARLAGLAPDGVTIFTLEGDSIRGALVSSTRMTALMAQAHELGPLETLVLGKAFCAAALLSVTLKGNDRLSLKAEGSGPAQGYVVECSADGSVRGRLFAAPFDMSSLPEHFDSGDLVGPGSLSITRLLAGRTQPVSGLAAAQTGRLAEDLAYYYQVSEQLRTSFTLSAHFDDSGRVAGAGGLYLQALPFASDEALDRVERLVYGLPSLGETFATGASRMDVCLRSFPFFDFNMLDERPVRFLCPCDRERMSSFIAALPEAELVDLAEHGPFPVELRCHNCNSNYRYKKDEIKAILEANRLH